MTAFACILVVRIPTAFSFACIFLMALHPRLLYRNRERLCERVRERERERGRGGRGLQIRLTSSPQMDRYTASASEVLAGALRDNCRGVVAAPSRSFGKGLIQGS